MAQGTQVLVVPASLSVAPSAVFAINLEIRNVQHLYGFDLQLTFDPDKLEAVEIAAGSFPPPPLFEAERSVDNETGQARYVVALMSPAPAVSGSGIVLTIRFKALAVGVSALELEALLADDAAAAIPAEVLDGYVVIGVPGATSTPTPTATVTATRTPTASATPTLTPTPSPTVSGTPVEPPTATATSTRTPTGQPGVFWVRLPLVVRNEPPPPTATPTATQTRTSTPTPSSTATPSLTPTSTSSPVVTPSGTPSVTLSPTASPTGTASPSPSATTSEVATASPTASATATPTPTATTSPSPSPTASATLPPQNYRQLLVNPSFETDEAWQILQTVYPAGYSVSRARSGQRSMRLGIIAPFPAEAYSSVEQEFELPVGLTEAVLTLYYFPVSTVPPGDYLYVVLYRASDGTELHRFTWMERHQAWNLQTVDLTAFAGQRVRLRIGLYNDGEGLSVVYLDDVEVWVGTAG